MAISKYDAIYYKLREDLEIIKAKENYNNLSLAFAHWFLENQYNLTTQEISEKIIDGSGDYGIDAVIYDEVDKSLEIFQFKFPNKTDTIKKEIAQGDVHKVIAGFDYLIDSTDSFDLENASTSFKNLHDELKESVIYNFSINFVSFNQGVIDNLEVINNFIDKTQKQIGTKINFLDYNVQKVSNIFKKLKRQNSVNIDVPYKQLQQSYSVNNEIQSYVGFLNAKDLLESIEDSIGVIFDENIRLSEIKSKINDGIKLTSMNNNLAPMFYFYNNGITFICDNIQVSPNALKANLSGASIVNGCQTVTSLYETYKNGKLKDEVDLLVRVIKISDYDQRSKITQYLNSQNQIKESYFISNHTIIRDLQSKLLEKGYYLERQINESTYKEKYTDSNIKKNKIIVKLDDIIQYYSGYFWDKYAVIAKRNKAILFSSDYIEDILSNITADRVIESYEAYQVVASTITSYRRQRRNRSNTEFAKLLNITNEELDKDELEFLFINTADILILNTCKHIKTKNKLQKVNQNTVIEAIKHIKQIIQKDNKLKIMTPATLTKNGAIYTEVQNSIESKP